MRGEHCIAGASLLTFIAVILLAFANIGQVSSAAVANSIYLVQVDMEGWVVVRDKCSSQLWQRRQVGGEEEPGLAVPDAERAPRDKQGPQADVPLRPVQWVFDGTAAYPGACGYQKDNSGVCNATQFAYPFIPMAQLVADAPIAPMDYKKITQTIIPESAAAFKNNGWNSVLSRIGSALIFVGSMLTLVAFIAGLIKHRLSFFVASFSAGISAFLLLIGTAIWTSIIAKDAWLKIVQVEGKVKLGILVTAGPTLCAC